MREGRRGKLFVCLASYYKSKSKDAIAIAIFIA